MKYILIGQKNVGKSSIFNKIIGKKLNIVDPTLGSTRDWIEYQSIYRLNVLGNLLDELYVEMRHFGLAGLALAY